MAVKKQRVKFLFKTGVWMWGVLLTFIVLEKSLGDSSMEEGDDEMWG